jgi:hypothetical protein
MNEIIESKKESERLGGEVKIMIWELIHNANEKGIIEYLKEHRNNQHLCDQIYDEILSQLSKEEEINRNVVLKQLIHNLVVQASI